MRVLTDLVFDESLTDIDKTVMIALHYACSGKQKHTVKLNQIEKLLSNSINISRSIKKFRDNKNYIVCYEQRGKLTNYEFVIPNKKGISFETISDDHLEKLLHYPKYLILFMKLKHVNWQLEQDRKKENPQFENEVKALRYYGLDIDDFESTMDFLKGLGIVSNYQIKLSAQLNDGETIFSNIDQPVIKNEIKPINNSKQVAEQPKIKQNKKIITQNDYDNKKEHLVYLEANIKSLEYKIAHFYDEIKYEESKPLNTEIWQELTKEQQDKILAKTEEKRNEQKVNLNKLEALKKEKDETLELLFDAEII